MSEYSEAAENFDKAARAVNMPTTGALHDLLYLTSAVSVRNGFCAFVPPGRPDLPWKCEVYASQQIGAGSEVSIREVYEGESLIDCARKAHHDLQMRFRWQGTEAEARGDVW